MYSAAAPDGPSRVRTRIARCDGLALVADLAEASATRDLILGLPSARFGIIRYVERATFRDQTELATMLAQGDFVWAGLVYDGEDEAGPFSPIESFHVSELDRLVERLREVRESFDETR